MYAAVNRIAEDGKTVVAPDERIGVERALRAVTIDAAYSEHIKDFKIWGTVLGGKPFKSKGLWLGV